MPPSAEASAGGIAGRDEQAGLAFDHQVGHAADSGRDDRLPGRHQLHQGEGAPLPRRARHAEVHGRDDVADVVAVTEKRHDAPQPALGDQRLELRRRPPSPTISQRRSGARSRSSAAASIITS